MEIAILGQHVTSKVMAKMTFGAWLKRELDAQPRGARTKLANILRVGPATISQMISGGRQLKAKERTAVQKFLRKPIPAELIGDIQFDDDITEENGVRVVGYAGAGSTVVLLHMTDEYLETIVPPKTTESTVAVHIRGQSMGAFMDRAYVFYDQREEPITDTMIGKLCIVETDDGRIMIKIVQRTSKPGYYNLLSINDQPIKAVRIKWAAKVKSIALR